MTQIEDAVREGDTGEAAPFAVRAGRAGDAYELSFHWGENRASSQMHVLDRYFGEVERGMNELRQRSPKQIGRISKNRFVARNAATIEGTRIPVATIKRYSDAGYSVREILDEYPSLAKSDIRAALAYKEDKKQRVA